MIDGLKRAIEIIDQELPFAKEVNPQMAFGMMHIKRKLDEELTFECPICGKHADIYEQEEDNKTHFHCSECHYRFI